MSELKTNTNQMSNYSFKITDKGMQMSDSSGSFTWDKNVLSQLAKAGDPVGLKYQSLNDTSKSSVKPEGMSSSISKVTNIISNFVGKIVERSDETSKMCNNLNTTSKNYTSSMEKTETALSGGKNSVSNAIVNSLITKLPNIDDNLNIDFGKDWSKKNNESIDSWNKSTQNSNKLKDSSNNAMSQHGLKKQQDLSSMGNVMNVAGAIGSLFGVGKSDQQTSTSNSTNSSKSHSDNAMSQQEFKLTDKGMQMSDGSGSFTWDKNVLSQLAKAGDPVGLKYRELKEQQGLSNIENVINAAGAIGSLFSVGKSNQQTTVDSSSNLNSNYNLSNSDSSETIRKYDSNSETVNEYIEKIIASGCSESKLKQYINDNDNAIKQLRVKIKSGELTGHDLEDAKSEMKKLGEVSKQLLQNYGTVTSSDYQNEKIISKYVSETLKNPKAAQKMIDDAIKENKNIIASGSKTAVEKGIATKNLYALTGISNSLNPDLFDDKTNKKIDEMIDNNICEYINSGLTSKDVDNLMKSLDKDFNNNVISISQTYLTDDSLTNTMVGNCLNIKEKETLKDVKKDLKAYEQWEKKHENEFNYVFKDGVTKSEKTKYINENNKEIRALREEIKSGKLSQTDIALYKRKINLLSQCNSLAETNYNKNITFKKVEKEESVPSQGNNDNYTDQKTSDDYINLVKDNANLESKKEEYMARKQQITEARKTLPSDVFDKQYKNELEQIDYQIGIIDYDINNNQKQIEAISSTNVEMYQDLKKISDCYENINIYKREMAETDVGNSKAFYQNMISTATATAERLEKKWNINSSTSIKDNAIKGFNASNLELSDLEKHKNEYTDDEYEKKKNAILTTMNDNAQQYFHEETKDDWKNFISLRNSNKDLEHKLASSTNPTEISQLTSMINKNNFKMSGYKDKLGLGQSYDISSTKSEINKLEKEQIDLKKGIEDLVRQSNVSPTNKGKLADQIAEKQKEYDANNKVLKQKRENLNILSNKDLINAYDAINKELENAYKENDKYNRQHNKNIESIKGGNAFVGPQPIDNSVLFKQTENNQKIEQLESLKTTYSELAKMNRDNGLENNINILIDKNINSANSNNYESKKKYIDNQILNLYNIGQSLYENKESTIDFTEKVNEYWINNHPQEAEKDNRSDFEKFISGVGATVCQTGMTLWHGVENAAESVVDFAATVGTGITSLGTSVIDLVNGNFGGPNSITQKLYDDLDSFVATDWIGNAADSIYNTDFGKWVNDNSVYKRDDIFAGITRGVGEVAGKVAFASVLAGGAGTVGSSATTATTGTLGSNSLNITKALSSTKVMQPIVAGITGYGQGMEDALNDGATHTGAAAFASANALWEAAQWEIGGKINEWTGSSLANSTSLAKNWGILSASVAADTVDSAVEGFVQPAMKMIYNGKNFEQSFKDNGGWETVGVQAALGGIMSALGSTKDFVSSNRNILSAGKTLPTTDDAANKVVSKVESIGKKIITPEPKKQVFNADGNKVSLSEQVKNKFKTVTGVSSATLGFIGAANGVLSGNPIFAGAGLPMFYKGIKNTYDGVLGNYVVGSNFSVYRHKVTDAIDANFKPGRSYAEGKLTANKIVTDRIGQNVLDGKIFLTGRLDTNQERVFGLPLINLIQQLKPLDANGNKIIYSCQSQSQTLMLLRNLSKEGYIDNLKYSKSILSSQNLEKHLMGADVTGKKHQLYEMNFEVSKDKIFDIAAAADKAKMLGFDPNLYDAKIKKINGKEVILYEANLSKMLENVAKSKVSTSGLSILENVVGKVENGNDKVIGNTMDSSIKSAKKTNINFDEVSSNSSKKSSGLLGNLFGLFNKKNQKIVGDISNSDKLVTKILYDYNKNISDIDYINSLSPSERLTFVQNRVNEINSNPVISKLDIFKDNADETALSTLKNLFYENYLKNPEGTANFINNIVGIKHDNPNFKINFLFGDGSAADNTGLNIDNFSANSLDIAIHEFGHSLDINYRMKTKQSKTILPEFKNILENARKNCDMKAIIEYGKDSNLVKSNLDKTLLTNLFDKKATQLGTLDAISREFNNFCQNNSPNLKKLPDNLIKEIQTNYIKGNPSLASAFETGILKYDYATAEFLIKNSDLMDNINVGNLGNELYNLNLNKYMNLYDPLGEFVSSIVLNGNDKPLKVGLNEYYYPTGHSSDYYEEGLDNIYAELFTEFNRLKEIGDVDSLNNIKTMFGEEFYNFFDKQTIKVNYYYHNN